MVREVLEALKLTKPAHLHTRIIDATLGTGGYSLAMINQGAHVLGIEKDPEMLKIARSRIGESQNFKSVLGDFSEIASIAKSSEFQDIDGIVFDLGVSNLHLTDPVRGFSFASQNAELDMRLNPDIQGVKASDLLNGLRKDQLLELFSVTLDWKNSQNLVRKIVQLRTEKPIKYVSDFLETIKKSIRTKSSLNPGTLPFLALRIAVNSELDNLTTVLPQAFTLLKEGGRLVVVTFHSGEDVIVKNFFREKVAEDMAVLITRKTIKASDEERENNPRSRSARMRVLEKKRI